MNCKPGDLAYIVRSRISENIGAIVEVLSFYRCEDRDCWYVKTFRPMKGTVRKSHPTIIPGSPIKYYCFDTDLRPISGVPVHDEVTEEVSA